MRSMAFADSCRERERLLALFSALAEKHSVHAAILGAFASNELNYRLA
jgi:hypothetical protein